MSATNEFPTEISKYTIDKVLGQGAMGVVYKGLDPQIERPVAIKVLHEHLRQGDHGKDLESRFMQEAKAAARCLHPNIVTIFDFGAAEGQHFIVMEYVEGIELKAHLKADTPISLASAVDITIQILEALSHAHSKGIVHRDIKPANIILLEDGAVKVSDFGVARLDTSDLTSTGFMIGTPNYMSPEGLQGQTVDARSDIYSVGVLFYELLTRRRPLKGVSLDESIQQIDMEPHLSVQNIQSIKPILLRALQPLAEVRFQNAADFIGKLKSIEDMDLTEAQTAFFPAPNDYSAATQIAEPVTPSATSSQWNDDVLTSIEQTLAKFVGPMARVLVKKSSSKSDSIEELSAKLALHIPNDQERNQFLEKLGRSGISKAVPLSNTTRNKSIFTQINSNSDASKANASLSLSIADVSDEKLQQLAKMMAFYVGPLATRLVKQCKKKSSDINGLIIALAEHIPSQAEQEKFLQDTKKLL
ncbi:MAG: serine/threonine protein kinase [Pseudomonadales bacterium]|nr:serine/threonine protein kinase [Pseudomonadales bacterium]